MIVRETQTHFYYLNQHDHAHVSGEIAAHWAPLHFSGADRREAVLLAIYEHDRAWIPLDTAPFWNDKTGRPYSFTDYPAALKLVHYRLGLNEVEQLNLYAALLCSLHYTSFPALQQTKPGRQFLATEAQRQQKIRQELDLQQPDTEAQLQLHLQLLKFCDDLSLYLCLNEPGVAKADEHPWYQDGMPHSDHFAFAQNQLIQAHWLAKDAVRVQPFPFTHAFWVTIRYKALAKASVAAQGLAACFQQTPVADLAVLIKP